MKRRAGDQNNSISQLRVFGERVIYQASMLLIGAAITWVVAAWVLVPDLRDRVDAGVQDRQRIEQQSAARDSALAVQVKAVSDQLVALAHTVNGDGMEGLVGASSRHEEMIKRIREDTNMLITDRLRTRTR